MQTYWPTLPILGGEILFIRKKYGTMYGYNAAKEADWDMDNWYHNMSLEDLIIHFTVGTCNRLLKIWNNKYRGKPTDLLTLRAEIIRSKVFNIKIINANEFIILGGNISINVRHARKYVNLLFCNFIFDSRGNLGMDSMHTIEFLKSLLAIENQLEKDAYDWAVDLYKERMIQEILSQQ